MKEYIITAFDFQETIVLDPFRAKDVPELVRCRDCKKRYTVLCIQEEAGNINNQDNWYCADGERKESR